MATTATSPTAAPSATRDHRMTELVPLAKDVAARGKHKVRVIRGMAARGNDRRKTIKARHQASPPLRSALKADVEANLKFRGEGRGPLSRSEAVAEAVRLTVVSDAFLAQVLYRGRVALLRRGVPLVPRMLHHWSMATSQVCIGDPVIVGPGLYLPHGQVVVDGLTELGSNVILFPWTTVGLRAGSFEGPRIGDGAHIGTGAKVIGSVVVGESVKVGANAVVAKDVPAGQTVAGVPARPTRAPSGTQVGNA